jgi:hypothetical protein
MKRIIVTLITGMGMLCALQGAGRKEFKEHLSREFSVSKDATGSILYIYNISGFIKVEGYQGDKVVLEMDKTITADDEKNLETGRKEFSLAFNQNSDTLLAYISKPFDSRPHRKWQYNDDRGDIDYNYNVDFTVKVPSGMNLHISTINDGIIEVNNVSGTLYINNVNEKISVRNARGKTFAHTINGDVTINYLTNPPDESSFYTINGNINVTFQPGLSADLQFKSMNGDFFTNFSDVQKLPAAVIKEKETKGEGLVYKLNAKTSVRFGKGGKTFKFETLNGNVYIKKQS